MSKMSPVAQVLHLEREFAKERAQWQTALQRIMMQNHKLRQEVTGGLQIVGYLASQCPDNTLFIKATDLVATVGSVQRKHDAEHDVYAFVFVPPSAEELAELQKEVEAAVDAPSVALGEADPTDDALPVAIGDAE